MRLAPILLTPLAVLTLAGCGGDSTDEASAPTQPSPSVALQSPFESGPEAGSEGRPAPGTCDAVPMSGDGVYAVADAGTVTMIRRGDSLVLDGVDPAEGWETETVEEEEREIEVEFRGDGTQLDFEAGFDDAGAIEIEICSDDD